MIEKFKDVDSLRPYEFEEFVKTLFEDAGWSDAHITKAGQEYKSGDGGVDIFAYRNGKKFAIEVKQRNVTTTVDVKSLNQLVTGAKLAKASNSILVTNSYFTAEVKTRALRLGVELVDRDELKNLWFAKHSEIGREIKPRKYQSEIIDDCYRRYQEGKEKLLIEMATGLGKTYTVSLLIKRLIAGERYNPKILFLAHQVEILLQTVTAFKNVFGLGDYSFSACFAGAAPENTDFVFGSFDTLYSQLDQLKSDRFDFIVVDEAHHTPAATYSQVVQAFKPRLLIGLTATPFRADNKEVTTFFGGVEGHVGKYDLVWALANRKLAFPRYHVLLDDLDQGKIDQLEIGLSISDLDKKLFLHRKDDQVVKIIEKTVQQKNLDPVKGIVFCRNISHMKHLIKFFELGSAIYVHSQQNEQIKRENIRKFREESYKFILVCDLFNEGIDIPEANLLVFMRYTGSQTIWLQQLGRGLRKTENKEFVEVLDFVGSLDRLNQITSFARAVKETKRDPDEIEEPKSKRASQIHDSSIEVVYSDSAAKVLDLIQSLSYRLNSRTSLIDKIQSFYQREGYLPKIDELESLLTSTSCDQIGTNFGSYYGYIKAAFGDEILKDEFVRVAQNFIDNYKARNFIEPSDKAIASGLSYGFLPYLSENDISELELSNGRPRNIKISDSFDERGESSDAKKSPKNDNSPVGGEGITSALDAETELLFKYFKTVYTRTDFELLESYEKEVLMNFFKSPSVLIAKLNRFRKA